MSAWDPTIYISLVSESDVNQCLSYFGWIGNNNLGDEAIYTSNSALFDNYELVNQKYISDDDMDAALFPGGTILPKVTIDWSLDQIPECIDRVAIGVGIKNPKFWNRKFSTLDISHYLRFLGQDEILRNPAIQYLLKPFNHMSESVNCTDHYVREDELRLLSKFEHLGVRGPLSANVLRKRGISCDIVGDTALILEPEKYHPEETKTIIVTLREGGEKWKSNTSYRKSVMEFCKQHEDEYSFVFLPHAPSDIPLHIKMSKKVDNSRFVDFCSHINIEDVLDLTSKSDLVIGEKLHANVLSASTHTPFISLEYQEKNRDFAKSINMGRFNKSIGEITTKWLNQKFEKCVNSTNHRNMIEKEVKDMRGTLQSYESRISDTLS